MAQSIFMASGREFRVDEFLSESWLQPTAVFRQGTVRSEGGIHAESGFTVGVGAQGGDLHKQQWDALEFIRAFEPELERLAEFDGVTRRCLQIAYRKRRDENAG